MSPERQIACALFATLIVASLTFAGGCGPAYEQETLNLGQFGEHQIRTDPSTGKQELQGYQGEWYEVEFDGKMLVFKEPAKVQVGNTLLTMKGEMKLGD